MMGIVTVTGIEQIIEIQKQFKSYASYDGKIRRRPYEANVCVCVSKKVKMEEIDK